MDGGLPYDDSAMDEDVPVPAPAPAKGHPMLDRALDDFPSRGYNDADTDNNHGAGASDAEFAQYATMPSTAMSEMFGAPPTTSRDRGVVPDHIANLLGRMSRSKVYLAEESDGIIHHDAEARLRGDPRLARLADELDSQDPTSWLEAISEHASVRIRPNALFVSSELIKHLSTAKVFTWASQAGATAMGIEWLNDSTLILLFSTPAAALLGLSMLAKAGFDPTEGDDPLLERAAHGIPPSLLPQVEAEPEPKPDTAEDKTDEPMDTATAPAPADGVRRRGRGAFGTLASDEHKGSAHGAFDLEPLAPTVAPTFAEGVDPHARVTIRYATDADHVVRRGARDSEWYARHGRGAGKEVSRRNYGGSGGAAELKDRVGTAGEGREFARRLGRQMERQERGPYARREKRSAGDLDAELERMAAGRAAGEDLPPPREERGERHRGRGRGRRDGSGRDGRGPSNRVDLDRELDEMFAARGSG